VSKEIKPLILTFGAGVNARARSLDVDVTECAVPGENFNLDVGRNILSRRAAFDLISTAPNAGEIRGGAQLVKRDGTITTLIQAGTNVYSWDTASSFTLVGTVSGSSRIRGNRNQNWLLDQTVIITDLEKQTQVKQWDGTTFGNFVHNLGNTLYAKYCRVVGERVFFGNVTVGTTDTPHVILGSALSDEATLTNANRPSSSLSAGDAFFIPTPDLRPINGFEQAFGQFIISTQRGSLFRMDGADARDFTIENFYSASIAGDEAILNIGNDVLLGLEAHIDSLSGTLDFGDVETNDISAWISPLLRNTREWTMVYDRRLQRIFCFPDDQAACWVLHKSLISRNSHGIQTPDSVQEPLSPWVKWTTSHSMAFQPTYTASILSSTGDNMVIGGDTSGNLYRLDGFGGQDGGTTDVTMKRRSGVFRVPDSQIFDVEGWILYTSAWEQRVTIRFLWAGHGSPDREFNITLPVNSGIGVWGGDFYWGSNSSYWGSEFSGRIRRQDFAAPGQNNYAQIEIETTGEVDYEILEVGVKVRAVA
jgi:hypothetical protein